MTRLMSGSAMGEGVRLVGGDVLRQDREQLLGWVDRALGLVLRQPDDDSDLGDGFHEILLCLDVSSLGVLNLPADRKYGCEEVNVTRLPSNLLPGGRFR